MKPFVSNAFPTVGVEQELHLISPQSADLVSDCDHVIDALEDPWRSAASHELFYSVLEMRSPVCRTAAELEEAVCRDRRAAAEACGRVGCRPVAAGTHPFARWTGQQIVRSDHYRWVEEEAVFLARRLLAFGLHVHVGVASAEAAIYAMNELPRWLYPLLALSVNSPFLEGRLTGLASTRAHLFDSMPRTNPAPRFADFQELVAFHDKLKAAGDIMAPGDLWWSVRPQPPLGTVEVRILDLPTDVRRLGTLGAIVQALVATYQDRFQAGEPPAEIRREYFEQNHWQAMRRGLDGKIIEPATGEVLPMREQIERMLEFAAPKSRELQSQSQLAFAREMLTAGSESQQQVERWEALGQDLVQLELEIADRTVPELPEPQEIRRDSQDARLIPPKHSGSCGV
jgi:carboxylate-amine ligase